MEEVVKHFVEGYGCKFFGTLEIDRVPGHFRISFSGKHLQMAEYLLINYGSFDFTHRINRLQFGEDSEELVELKEKYA